MRVNYFSFFLRLARCFPRFEISFYSMLFLMYQFLFYSKAHSFLLEANSNLFAIFFAYQFWGFSLSLPSGLLVQLAFLNRRLFLLGVIRANYCRVLYQCSEAIMSNVERLWIGLVLSIFAIRRELRLKSVESTDREGICNVICQSNILRGSVYQVKRRV